MRRIIFISLLLSIAIPISAQTRAFAEAEVDVSAPYIGQPIIYTLRIYTAEAIENSTVIEPSFFGFGRSSVILEPSTYTESVESVPYHVIEQSYVIYPLRAGELTIDPFRIELPETPFDPPETIFNDAIAIQVQDYPEPAPESFVNAVGQFDIRAQAIPQTLSSGDALTLTITVSGTGNFEQMLAPRINLPENWRLFDGRTSYQQDNLRFGTKLFQWTVIVQGDGAVTLPAIEFSYFNPQTGDYESRSTAPIALTIASSSPQPEVTIERTRIVLTEVPVPDLLVVQANNSLPPKPPFWLWAIWALPPLVTLFVWLLGRPKQERIQETVSRKPRKKSGSRALRDLRDRLQKAQSLEPKLAYEQIANAIYQYLGTKTGELISESNVQSAMRGFPANYRDALLSCLEEASAGQYAPVTSTDVQNLSQRVLRVCAAIEKAS